MLLRKAGRGHEAAFCELFARYQRRIYQYASRMCGSAAAEDIVQETFLAVLKPGAFDSSRGTVAGYLFGIARHQVVKHLKNRDMLMEPSDPRALNIAASQDTQIETVVRQQAVSAVRAAVQSLPPIYREVVVLCDLEELDYATVAEVIDCPIGTVRSRLHRARSMLVTTLTADSCDNELGRNRG